MRGRLFILLGLALAGPSVTLGADPAVSVPAPERVEATSPDMAPQPPVVNEKPRSAEKPKPVEKPKLVEKPKPVEKPKLVEKPLLAAETARPPEVTPGKPIEPPAPAVVPVPTDTGVVKQSEARNGYSIGCLALAFAMLIIGVVAGFLGRHLMSRHKLGGMTVRIGTWRGIP